MKMNYSKEIESLIDSVIAKGVITEQDRNSIIRKAVIQGIDPEELNTELDTRLCSVAIPKERSKHPTSSSEDNNHSMFSKELENLIHATLEDGVLEEYEKAALVKRAQSEGADLTELEIYINSLLQKRARELENVKNTERKNAEKEKREAFGRKCPNCGAQVPPLTVKCECGYEFTNNNQVSSVQIFANKIEQIQSQTVKGDDNLMDFEYTKAFKEKQDRIISVIQLFPVPNTKEDIIEFLALSIPNAKVKKGFMNSKLGRALPGTILGIILIPLIWGLIIIINTWGKLDKDPIIAYNRMAEVWRAKCEQVLIKGRSLRGDADFQKQLDYYESILNN